jgi:hypothetical protein
VEDAVDEASGAWGGRPDAMLALEKKAGDQARLSFSKVRWQARERRPYLLDFDPETESFTFVKEEEDLDETPHRTAKEIAAAIGASEDKVKEALEGHPGRFRKRTGDEAKAIGRHPSAHVWEVHSPQNAPDAPPFSQGELE